DRSVQARRTAAWRVGARDRPRRDAAGRRAEYPRGDRLPDEPARAGRDDGGALPGQVEAVARAFDPGDRAAQGRFSENGTGEQLATIDPRAAPDSLEHQVWGQFHDTIRLLACGAGGVCMPSSNSLAACGNLAGPWYLS